MFFVFHGKDEDSRGYDTGYDVEKEHVFNGNKRHHTVILPNTR